MPGISELKVAGFGACMISGYPHKQDGLFEVACALLEERLSRPVKSNLVSLGGFPAPRAEKHLQRKVLKFHPDYVVIQLASTDAQCPIRRANRSPLNAKGVGLSRSSSDAYHSQPAGLSSLVRWEVASLIGHFLKIGPITPLPDYVASIERMARACRAERVTPVVLSPFVCGSRYAMRSALAYTRALQDLAKVQDMIFVDCVSELRGLSKTLILQHDGFHLTPLGHRVVGDAIARSIAADSVKMMSRAS